jgi:hypothetical protein
MSCLFGGNSSQLILREQHLEEQVQAKDAQLQRKICQLDYLQQTCDNEIEQKDIYIAQLVAALRQEGVEVPASLSAGVPLVCDEADDEFHDCIALDHSGESIGAHDEVVHAHTAVVSQGGVICELATRSAPKIKNPDFNWNAGYIGHLSQSQADALEQLRGLVSGSTAGDEEERKLANDDRGLLRFLRARDFDVKKAFKMASATLDWRKKWKPRNITFDRMPTAAASGTWRFAGHTKCGMPIILARTSLWRPREYYGTGEFVNYVAWFLETALTMRTIPSDSSRDDCDIQRIFVVFDLKGFSLYHHNDMRCITR